MDKKEEYKGFPNPFATPEEKASKEYGLNYAQAIWSHSQRNTVGNLTRKQRDIINRKYAEGLESIQKYKDRLDLNGDTSFLNLDFNPTTRIAMIVDNILGKLMNQDYKIQCDPIDPLSKTKEDEDRREMYTNMLLKPISDELQQKTGIPLVPTNKYIPESDDEAEMHFQMDYKQDASLSMEEALSVVFYNNNFKDIEKKVRRDLIVLKKGAVRRGYDENGAIVIEYIDPLDLIVPYSKHDDFRNITYVGILHKYTIGEIAQMTNEFDEETLWNIAKSQAGKNNNAPWAGNWATTYEGYYATNWGIAGRPYDDFNVTVMEFYFLTPEKVKYSKKETGKGNSFYFDKKDSNYKAPKESKYKREVIERDIQYLYGGFWIATTEWMYGYKKINNVERERSNGAYSPKAELPVSMIWPQIYDMENKSLVERMIPHEDQINLIKLKMQQFMIKAAPPGVAVDVTALDEVILGLGQGKMKPQDITRMWQQTGSYPFASQRSDGSLINGRPIEPLTNGISKDFGLLIQAYNHEIQMINDVIGFNSAVDASSPPVDALVGTQKLAAQASNNALRPLNESFIRIVEKLASRLTLMIQDSMEYDNKGFINSISRYAVNTIKYGKKISLNEFGIKVQFMPDEEERAEILQLIAIGLQNGTLKTSDAITIKQVLKSNVKLAAQYLILRERKNAEQKQKESALLQQQNAEVQSQSAQAASAADAQAQAAIMEAEKAKMKYEYELKNQFEEMQLQRELKKIEAQNIGKIQVQQVSNVGKEKVVEKQHESNLSQSVFDNITRKK